MKRFVILAVILAIVAIGLLLKKIVVREFYQSAAAEIQSQPLQLRQQSRLVVQFPTYGGYAPGILYNRGLDANEDSLFTKNQGLRVALKVIDAPETAVSAFVKGGAGGGVDIMSFTIDMYAATYSEFKKSGLDTVAILLTSWSNGGDGIAASKEIQDIQDLRGKKLACAQITPSHYYALYVLNQAGLTNDDVKWIFTQTAIDAANVFKAGRVDACVSWAPDVYEAAKGREGGHILSSTKETGRLIGDIFIVKRDFAEKHVDVLARFCQGWLEGVRLTKERQDEAAIYLADAFKPAGIDKDAAKYLMSVVQFADENENLSFFDIHRGENPTYKDVYEMAGKLWKKFGVVESSAPARDTIFAEHFKQIEPKVR